MSKTYVMRGIRVLVHAPTERSRRILPSLSEEQRPAPRVLVQKPANVMDETRHDHEHALFRLLLDFPSHATPGQSRSRSPEATPFVDSAPAPQPHANPCIREPRI